MNNFSYYFPNVTLFYLQNIINDVKTHPSYIFAQEIIKKVGQIFLETNFDLIIAGCCTGGFILFGTPSMAVALPILGMTAIHHIQNEMKIAEKAEFFEYHQKLYLFFNKAHAEWDVLANRIIKTTEHEEALKIYPECSTFFENLKKEGLSLNEDFIQNNQEMDYCQDCLKSCLSRPEYYPILKKEAFHMASILYKEIEIQKEIIKLREANFICI